MLGRPFYQEFAWAYDLIIAGPVHSRCDFWQHAVSQRGVPPGSNVLDAGCGSGSYAIELARRGYVVTGLDASAPLLAIARQKAAAACVCVAFQVGDIRNLPAKPRYRGILCRGVLNDIIDDAGRRDAFSSFARVLDRNGTLVLDVREWNGTALKKTKNPVFEKRVETDRGTLTFRSVTQLDHAARQLQIAERHCVEKNGEKTVAQYDFVMRCWTQEELHTHLTDAGFGSIAYFGDYDQDTAIGSTDRMVAVASWEG